MNFEGTIQRVRRWKLAYRGVHVDRNCYLHGSIAIGGGPKSATSGSIVISPECEIGRGVQLYPWGGSIKIARRVFIGAYAVVYGHGGVSIGEQTLISMHCCIVSSNHTIPPAGRIIRDEPDILLPTTIGPNCWLGAGVKVLGGIEIGEGCVIGAGAVVTKSLLPNSVAVGVPASVIGSR
jgi:serine acetyltransferase